MFVLDSTKMVYRKAVSCQDLRSAAKLVACEYKRKGYLPCDDDRVVSRIQSEMAGYDVFVACYDDRVLTTLSVITTDGLPMDTIYGPELNALRDQGLRLLEIGKCAGRSKHIIVMRLMAEVFRYSMRLPADRYVATVNPSHVDFYTRGAGYDLIAGAEARYHPHVLDAPAVGLVSTKEKMLASRWARITGLQSEFKTALV